MSDGGVHSHINHLFGLIDAANEYGINNLFIHAFTDGRDVDPKSGKKYIEDLCSEYSYDLTHFSKVNLRKEGESFVTGGVYILAF